MVRQAGRMATDSRKRGKGPGDPNVKAYETMLQATGQMPKVKAPAKRKSGISLRQAARKA